jgi:hypothetical protein
MKQFYLWAKELGAKAAFWNYWKSGVTMDRDYDKYAVFEERNQEHNELACILEDDIFKDPSCIMNGVIRSVKRK